MYINDYRFKDNKIDNENLSNTELIIHDTEVNERLNEIIPKEKLGSIIGNICNSGRYIHPDNIKSTPKKFDLTFEDTSGKKVIIELPFDKTKNRYKIIEENLIREYKIRENKESVLIDLLSIEFKNKKNSFKKTLSFDNGNNLIKIDNHIGFINLMSNEDYQKDEEALKDLVLSYEEAPSTEKLYFDIKGTLTKKYEMIQLLYKKTFTDPNIEHDEVLESNGVIKKFLVTKEDKQYGLTNELENLNYKNK